FCVDEKTAIQALDRKDRMLPLSPGRAESHGFEYKRNGTLSLFAALNTRTGEVIGRTAPRHTSEQFVAFLTDVIASQRPKQEIHVICDNVSSHKTPRVQEKNDNPLEPPDGRHCRSNAVRRADHHRSRDRDRDIKSVETLHRACMVPQRTHCNATVRRDLRLLNMNGEASSRLRIYDQLSKPGYKWC
ncbi:transposase, partial [Paraburkholderia sp. CNPSo 3076]|uniref:transposase n=1 Tax=Paraburkholderia sp. CNPSo 3076 TaxID=2940936 RepID=UPI0022565B3F